MKEAAMEFLLLVVAVLALVGAAAQRWGADSREIRRPITF
jgi:hypothetical protein